MNGNVYAEGDLLPISALSELVFCERRVALQQTERIWADNLFTMEGTLLHEKPHSEEITEVRGDVRITRGLRLRSLRLGLTGKADVVEFHLVSEGGKGIELDGVKGLWTPFPVEYKRGHMRHEKSFEIQLCAQALCLEEMLNTDIPAGALFYGKSARRYDVPFSSQLRTETEQAAVRLHEIIRSGETPKAVYEKKCDSCSLMPICLPKTISKRQTAKSYMENFLKEI